MPATPILHVDIKNRMMFRLLFGTQDDYYNADSAIDLLNGLRGLDDEALALSITLWAMDAEVEVKPN